MRIKPRYLVLFSALFILFTIIGTLSHELGHYIMARILGYEAIIHYGSTSYDLPDTGVSRSGFPYMHQLLITCAGPIQTMVTGIFGLMTLRFRESITLRKFYLYDWIAVFMSLFWLRELFNLSHTGYQLLQGSLGTDDEIRIAQMLGLPPLSLTSVLGFLALGIALFVVFKIVPEDMRLTFILSGLIGGLLAFELWMHRLGPLLLP